MKKIYGLIAAALFVLPTMAQTNATISKTIEERMKNDMSRPENQVTQAQLDQFMKARKNGVHFDKAGNVEGYVNYAQAIDDFFSNQVLSAYLTSMFPDTTVTIQYSDGQGGFSYDVATTMGIGGVYDPTFEHFKPIVFSLDDTIIVDSIFFEGVYFRNSPTADTMVLELINAEPVGSQNGPFSGIRFNANQFPNLPAADEAVVTTIDYAGTTSHGYHLGVQGTGSSVQYYKAPMTSADSGQTVIGFAVNQTLMPGDGLGYICSFMPEAGSYSAGDTIYLASNSGPNLWRPLFLGNASQTDDNAYMVQFWNETQANAGQMIYEETRYGLWSGGSAFLNDMSYGHPRLGHYITMKVRGFSTSTIGTKEFDNSGFSVNQNYPNPFSDVSFIEYDLTKASNVTVEVFDITGKSVLVINEGRKSAGSYKVSIDGSNLNGGVYYYNFRTEDGQVTKKMMIQK